jgi:hypothetical protein
MGFIDSIREALGSEPNDQSAPAAVPPLPPHARHVDRDAPAERMEDAQLVTGGKHARRD